MDPSQRYAHGRLSCCSLRVTGVPGDQNGQGIMEDYVRYSQLPDRVGNFLPWHLSWLPIKVRNGEPLASGQVASADFGYGLGVPI